MIKMPEIIAFWLTSFVTLSIQTLQVLRVIMYCVTSLKIMIKFVLYLYCMLILYIFRVTISKSRHDNDWTYIKGREQLQKLKNKIKYSSRKYFKFGQNFNIRYNLLGL